MWSEERIRKLMSADMLRGTDWDKTPPSERYRILMEAEEQEWMTRDELARLETPSLKAGWERYLLMVSVVVLLNIFLQAQWRFAGDFPYSLRQKYLF